MTADTDSTLETEAAQIPVLATTEHSNAPRYVVGIGASAGGLEALVQLFSVMPTNLGCAYVVVQHLSPDFKSVMDELLSRHTTMPVHLVEDRLELKANCVYLIPPKMEMVVLDGKLLLTNKDPAKSLSLPIDVFFRSLAQDKGDTAIAIILSGTGSDGSRGLVDIHDAGGLVIAQSEDSAKFNGMPRSAIETGMVDHVLAPEEMPQTLLKYTGSPFTESGDLDRVNGQSFDVTDQYAAIFKRLRDAFKIDFTYYKPTTVNRRIERRLTYHKLDSLEEYTDLLRTEPKEITLLYKDLLIGVTKFFRDPDAFEILEKEVIPQIIDSKGNGSVIRIWIPGCASGEEAYSMAILFAEQLAHVKKRIDVKIFATDLHSGAISHAAVGIYSKETMELLSEERREKFFRETGGSYQISPNIRKMIVFAEQNLLKDPPFTKIDFVSCRNLLIYFQPIAQKKVITMFLFALNTGGVLLLGPSESLGDMENEFDTINRQWNLFKKRKDVRLSPIVHLPATSGHMLDPIGSRSNYASSPSSRSSADVELTNAYDELLAAYMPPGVLIGANRQLVHVFGNGSDFISSPTGRASLDILNMVDGNIRLALSTAIQRVNKEREPYTLNNIPFDRAKGGRIFIDLTVKPQRDLSYMLISFEEHKKRPSISDAEDEAEKFDVSEETQSRIMELEKELQFSRENLQATIEELETSNEELQATNEELLASNEELQSTNEELQSVNEELFTVNTEYEKKNFELTQLNNDIDNLLQSTEIGTIFIDNTLRIRKFTPAIAETFNLLPMDIGRPFEHITFNIIDNANVVDQVRSVIQTRDPLIKEVRDREGKWMLMRIFPYITSRDESSGAVLTLVDIDTIKEAEEELQQRAHLLTRAKEDLESFAYAVSHDLQEPLRGVSGYIDLLKKRLKNQDPEIDEYIDFALEGSRRLKSQINALLSYTRIETQVKAYKKISLDPLIDEFAQSHADELDDSRLDIRREYTKTDLFADPGQAMNMVSHILSNAMKFRNKSNPVVTITAENVGAETIVHFKDNGIGIEPVNQQNVFNIFYKEHANEIYPGTGIGLALCKRIALKHKGRIWLESQVHQGSTISFALPREGYSPSNSPPIT